MNSGPGELTSREPDPLLTSSAGTALAGVGSLLWPGLLSAAFSLAALASFVVWIRALRALRRPRGVRYDRSRLLPLVLLGGVGWSGALLTPAVIPAGRGLILGALGVGLWVLARSAFWEA